MNGTNENVAESLYLAVYDFVADNGDYFQPGDDKKLLLPETIIASVVTAVLVPFLKGFCQKAGEAAFASLKDWTQRMQDKDPDAEEVVQLLSTTVPHLKQLQLSESEVNAVLTRVFQGELHMSRDRSREFSESISSIIVRELAK